MSILHVTQIGKKIRESFEPHIPRDDLNPHDPDIDSKVLTRCLAAFAIHVSTDCSPLDAGASVIDGGDDNGLDAVYFSSTHNALILVQSKWIKDGKSEPDSGEVAKFCNGVRDLVNSEFGRFNERLKRRQASVENALSNFNCRLVLVLAHTGPISLADHASRQIADLLAELNDATDIASFVNLPQERIYVKLAEGAAGGAITLEFGLSCWGKLESPHEAFYGTTTGSEIAAWWKSHGDRLFAQNLRSVLGATDVNELINATIESSPDDFWYFNNGITITAKQVKKTLAGGGNRDLGTFQAVGAFVVNGAQTVSTIGRFVGNPTSLERIRVPVRVISLEKADEKYGAKITRTNNTQNRIEARDFVSQDPEQVRLRLELQIEGVDYNIVRTESFKPSTKSFDLEEATAALACASGDPTLAVLAKRELGRFWADTAKAPYKRIFNASTSSLYVYHVTLVYRAIEERLLALLNLLGRQSGKRYGILVHGNRLIAAMTFKLMNFNPSLNDSRFTNVSQSREINQVVDRVVDNATKIVEERYKDNFLAVLFKNPTKSRELFEACISAGGQLTLPLAAESSST